MVSETTIGHCKKDDLIIDVYVGRGDGGDAHILNTEIGERGWLGNPFKLEYYSREEAISFYRQVVMWRVYADSEFRDALGQLSGKTLGCWCRTIHEDEPRCHGDVIAEVADWLVYE